MSTRLRELVDLLKKTELVPGPRRERPTLVVDSRKKFAILGFVIAVESILAISKDLLFRNESPYHYILTYKFSQDNLEIFFNNIRRRGGLNNNPNAVQFRQAYRRLIAADSLTYLSAQGNANCRDQMECDDEDVPLESPPLLPHLDVVAHDVVAYISGFVVRSVLRQVSCQLCRGALISQGDRHLLIDLRNNGGLLNPSADVVRICVACERVLQQGLATSQILSDKFLHRARVRALTDVDVSSLFTGIADHNGFPNSATDMMVAIAEKYIAVRLHYLGKLHSEQGNNASIRQKLHALINHLHQ